MHLSPDFAFSTGKNSGNVDRIRFAKPGVYGRQFDITGASCKDYTRYNPVKGFSGLNAEFKPTPLPTKIISAETGLDKSAPGGQQQPNNPLNIPDGIDRDPAHFGIQQIVRRPSRPLKEYFDQTLIDEKEALQIKEDMEEVLREIREVDVPENPIVEDPVVVVEPLTPKKALQTGVRRKDTETSARLIQKKLTAEQKADERAARRGRRVGPLIKDMAQEIIKENDPEPSNIRRISIVEENLKRKRVDDFSFTFERPLRQKQDEEIILPTAQKNEGYKSKSSRTLIDRIHNRLKRDKRRVNRPVVRNGYATPEDTDLDQRRRRRVKGPPSRKKPEYSDMEYDGADDKW